MARPTQAMPSAVEGGGGFTTSILELGGLGKAFLPLPQALEREVSKGRFRSFQSLFNVRINIL